MMRLLKMIFTWWTSQTLGTMLITLRRGELVGHHEQGKCNYQERHGASINGKTRRWVIYNGDIETSRVPAEWHGWLHYTVDETPDEAGMTKREWMKPHQMNLTGTKDAHKPAGPADTASYADGYDAWKPE